MVKHEIVRITEEVSGTLQLADVRRIAWVLEHGGACITPSDTGYAITTLPFRASSAETLNAIRDDSREMISLAFGSAQQVAQWVIVGGVGERLIEQLCPGPLTLVRPLRDDGMGKKIAKALRTPGTMAIRLPASLERQLAIELSQPVTSCALRDQDGGIVQDEATAYELVRSRISDRVRWDMVLLIETKSFPFTTHSTVVALEEHRRASAIRILRRGAIEEQVVLSAARCRSLSDFDGWT